MKFHRALHSRHSRVCIASRTETLSQTPLRIRQLPSGSSSSTESLIQHLVAKGGRNNIYHSAHFVPSQSPRQRPIKRRKRLHRLGPNRCGRPLALGHDLQPIVELLQSMRLLRGKRVPRPPHVFQAALAKRGRKLPRFGGRNFPVDKLQLRERFNQFPQRRSTPTHTRLGRFRLGGPNVASNEND